MASTALRKRSADQPACVRARPPGRTGGACGPAPLSCQPAVFHGACRPPPAAAGGGRPIEWLRFECADSAAADLLQHFHPVADALASFFARGSRPSARSSGGGGTEGGGSGSTSAPPCVCGGGRRGVLVHCLAGQSRSVACARPTALLATSASHLAPWPNPRPTPWVGRSHPPESSAAKRPLLLFVLLLLLLQAGRRLPHPRAAAGAA